MNTQKTEQIITYLLQEVSVLKYLQNFNRLERQLIPQLLRIVKEIFRFQRDHFIRLFKPIAQDKLSEALVQSDWLPLWEIVVQLTSPVFYDALITVGDEIYQSEYYNLLEFLGLVDSNLISFNIVNELAKTFFNPEKTISQINQTTQDIINDLVTKAIERGDSYNQLSRDISTRFTEFNTKRDINGNTRADRIAINEIRERHSGASEITAMQLHNHKNIRVYKKWITIGDNKVRPAHRKNEKQDYILETKKFDSGHKRPPTDPNCRCVLIRKTEIK